MVKLVIFNPNSIIIAEADKFICPVVYYKDEKELKIYIIIERDISLLQCGYNKQDYLQINNQINFKLQKRNNVTTVKENYD